MQPSGIIVLPAGLNQSAANDADLHQVMP